ncbi:hypothetical protein AAG906_039987 [Vitis piasezkii]
MKHIVEGEMFSLLHSQRAMATVSDDASGGTIDIQSEISWKRRLHQNPIDCCDDLKQRSSKQIASTWSSVFSFCCDQSQSTCEISQVCMGLNVGGLRGGHCDKNGCKSFGYIKGKK